MKQSHSAIQLRNNKAPPTRVKKLDLEELSFIQKATLNTYTGKYKKPQAIKVTRSQLNLKKPLLNTTNSKFGSTPSHVKSLQVSPKNPKGIMENDLYEIQSQPCNNNAGVFSSLMKGNYGTPSNSNHNHNESYKEDSLIGPIENEKELMRKELNKRHPGLYKVLRPDKPFEPVFKNLNSSIDSKSQKNTNKTTELSFEGHPYYKIGKVNSEKSFINNLESMYYEELKQVKKETSKLFLPRKSPYLGNRDTLRTPSTRRNVRIPSYVPPNDGSFVLESLETPYVRKLPEIRSPSMKDKKAVNRLKEMQAKAEILRSVKKIEEIGTPKRGTRQALTTFLPVPKNEAISRSLFSAESNLLSMNSSGKKFFDESRINMKKYLY